MNDPKLAAALHGLPEADVERLLNGPFPAGRDRFELLPHVAGLGTAVPLELGVMGA